MKATLITRTLRRIALLMGPMLLLGCSTPEEEFEASLPKDLVPWYKQLPGDVRTATAHRALVEIEALKSASWKPSIVRMEEGGTIHRPVYALGIGRAKLQDYRLTLEETTRTGSCSAFTYPALWKKGATVEQNIPVTLHLADEPHAKSAESAPLVLGVAGYSLEGTVHIRSADALVQGGTLLVPHPVSGAPGAFRVSLPEFSLLSSEKIMSIGKLEFAEPFPRQSSLEPLLGTDPISLFAVHGKLGIDLESPTQGYRADGEISVLGESLEGVAADIYPGSYIAASLEGLDLPGPIEGMCIPIRKAAVELDLASQILRVTGTTEIDSPASLLCDETLSLTLSFSLAAVIGVVRSLYNLPERFSAVTQLVLDKDDQVLCTDLAVQGKSLFRGAYLGSSGPVIWAPISSTSSLPMLTGDPQLPLSDPRKCWEGDPGPQAWRNHPR